MTARESEEMKSMIQILAVAAGGAVGSVLRYLLSRIPFLSTFPWSTLLVNLAGSFLLGLFFALAGARVSVSHYIASGVLLHRGLCVGRAG
jgi:fluoride exporter